MRLLFVNHVHPNSNLVAGVRLHRFAQEFAKKGHRVILLCGNGAAKSDSVDSFTRRLATHNWHEPLVLAVDEGQPPPGASHPGTLSKLLRKARTALRLVYHGGPFWRWRRNALVFAEPIHRLFAPQLCFGTIGNLDALAITRAIALRARIPWVMDIKDPMTSFIPRMLRPRLIPRYRDASAVTLNAEYQRTHNPGWADASSVLVYSGVEVPPVALADYDPAHVALVGSIYDDLVASMVLRGFAAWRQQAGNNATLHYFGVDAARLERIAASVGASDAVIIEGQVPRTMLLDQCSRMAALLYVRCAAGFHHKLLELAALGRPLVACPTEGDEAMSLCSKYDIQLIRAESAPSLRDALAFAALQPTRQPTRLIQNLSWACGAARLEQAFLAAISNHRPHTL